MKDSLVSASSCACVAVGHSEAPGSPLSVAASSIRKSVAVYFQMNGFAARALRSSGHRATRFWTPGTLAGARRLSETRLGEALVEREFCVSTVT